MKVEFFSIIIFILFIGVSCQEDSPEEVLLPTIKTNDVTVVTISKAAFEGSIVPSDNNPILSCGACWNLTGDPTFSDNIALSDQRTDTFNCEITGLEKNKTYHVKSFATTAKDTVYGNELVFNSLEVINGETIEDIDGNSYKTVKIGNQYWMAENLKVTHYRNGDAIPNVQVDSVWSKWSDTGYRCYYDNDSSGYSNLYGALYNNYAIHDVRNICPEGWHIPSFEEWNSLLSVLGDSAHQMIMLTEYWPKDANASNHSGFNALPSGARGFNGDFVHFRDQEYSAGWWSSHQQGWPYLLTRSSISNLGVCDPRIGFAIRCIKD